MQCRLDYKLAYQTHKVSPTQQSLTMYLDTHNAYVQQLHATNAMLESYHMDTLPQLLQELEDIYNDLCQTVSEAVLQSTEVISGKVWVGYFWVLTKFLSCRNVKDLISRAEGVKAEAKNIFRNVYD